MATAIGSGKRALSAPIFESRICAKAFAAARASVAGSTSESVLFSIDRRAEVVGIVANDTAFVPLVGALLLEQNDEPQLERRYMQFRHRISAVVATSSYRSHLDPIYWELVSMRTPIAAF